VNQSKRRTFFIVYFVLLSAMWVWTGNVQRQKLAAEQEAAAAKATQAEAPTAPTTPTAPVVLPPGPHVLPPDMMKELQLGDPAWAGLSPRDQASAISKRLNNLDKNDPQRPKLVLTQAWVLDQRVKDAPAEAAEAYRQMNQFLQAKEPYPFAGQALLRAADLYHQLYDQTKDKSYRKKARQQLDAVITAEQKSQSKIGLWEQQGQAWVAAADPYEYSLRKVDELTRGDWVYRMIDTLVSLTGRIPGWSQVLALLFLALGLKLLTFPLSRISYRSMGEMQRIQPLVQEMQKRYKDEPQKLNAEMMKLYREHGVNPFAGCLPMIIQMPFFIMIYQGIRGYTYHFHNVDFLWMTSLAQPDLALLILYGISMFVSQKIAMAGQPPASDPSQAQMQKTMGYMMPIMFTWMMWSWRLPSAFYLYWLAFNVIATVEQRIVKRKFGGSPAPADMAAPAAPLTVLGSSSAGPKPANRPAGRAGSKSKKRKK
jgi:YidC/Oxa1 family membrane protein insertase